MPTITDDQGNQWEIAPFDIALGGLVTIPIEPGAIHPKGWTYILKPVEKTETTEQVRAEYNPEAGEYLEKTEPVQETPENGQVSGDMSKQGTPEKGTPQNPCTCNHPACMMYHNESVDKDSLIEQLEYVVYKLDDSVNLKIEDDKSIKYLVYKCIKPLRDIINQLKND